jgi:hypothetical protein
MKGGPATSENGLIRLSANEIRHAERGGYVACIAGALSIGEYKKDSSQQDSPTSPLLRPSRSPTYPLSDHQGANKLAK